MTAIHVILKLIFENNFFVFNRRFFKQISGIAMGAKCAPGIANIYIAILEEKFLFIYKPSLYNRFIDDIFVILDHFFDINILKNVFGNLKLNIVCHTIVNFLDLIISLNPNSGSLSFSLYTKPTNTFSYLLSSSNHQKSIFENIPKSIFIRIRRICTHYSDFLFFARRLTSQLIKRGYNKLKLRKAVRTIGNMERNLLLPFKIKSTLFNDKKLLFFTFPYDFNSTVLKTAFYSAFNSIASRNSLRDKNFRIIHSMQQNLSSLFVHEFKLLHTKSFNFRKCNQYNCTVCTFSNQDSYILINNFYLPLMANSNCQSKDILYILTCKKCKTYYVGQSISAKQRLKSHIGAIRKNRTSSNCVCVHTHFNSIGHDALKFFTFNIFNVNIGNKFKRLCLESQLIHLFIKAGAVLINDVIPDVYYWYLNASLFAKI